MAEIVKSKENKKEVVYIDGAKHILGRLASYAAKSSLEGKEVVILNSEKVIITGKKSFLIDNYKYRMINIGNRHKGPFWPRRPDDIVRRAIKRMLPYKRARGAQAFKRIKTYIGVPKEFEGYNMIEIPKAKLHEDEVKFITIGELSKQIGGFNG